MSITTPIRPLRILALCLTSHVQDVLTFIGVSAITDDCSDQIYIWVCLRRSICLSSGTRPIEPKCHHRCTNVIMFPDKCVIISQLGTFALFSSFTSREMIYISRVTEEGLYRYHRWVSLSSTWQGFRIHTRWTSPRN